MSTSQAATTCVPGEPRKDRIRCWLCLPQPMNPSVIRSLGAAAPKTEDGTTVGKPAMAAAPAAAFRKSRRLMFL